MAVYCLRLIGRQPSYGDLVRDPLAAGFPSEVESAASINLAAGRQREARGTLLMFVGQLDPERDGGAACLDEPLMSAWTTSAEAVLRTLPQD
jgi:hypothetical protein